MPFTTVTTTGRACLLLLLFAAGTARAQAPGVPQGGAACATALDCSLGGECGAAGTCECDAWWTGSRCDLLCLAPAVEGAGLQLPGYFSWGGHALEDPSTGLYEGAFSFMCRHATLGEWTTKSSVWRATSASPIGPFALSEMIAQPWSHNAMLSQTNSADPAARYATYQIGDAVADPSLFMPCYQDAEAAAEFAPRLSAVAPNAALSTRDVRGGDANSVYVRTAPALTGPWTALDGNATDTPVPFIFPQGGWSTAVNGGNPAPFFFENGTVLMYYSANPFSPGNNCIGVARGDSWRGPFTALPLPVTHPESEDAFVFRDPRGSFHLLTNVNNDHTRCAQGVPCGGHAWSIDGLTFSNLTIGAFGPVFRFANGSYWNCAYAERPQVLQAADGTPIAFYLGVGRSNYYDSANFAQLFCVKGQQGCGPTLPPPAPAPTAVQYARGASGLCLATNGSGFPCAGGWGTSCPLFLASCTDAATRWLERADGSGFLESQLHAGVCVDVDCNSCAAHTVTKAMPCDSASALRFDSADGQIVVVGCGAGAACIDDGTSGAPNPPCKDGEAFLPTQLTLAACSSDVTKNWTRVVL